MIQSPPDFAPLTAAMIRRRAPLRIEPAVRSYVATPGFREDARFFLYAYVTALIVFLTWLA